MGICYRVFPFILGVLPMKQFTYKEFDIATGIVFTKLCCDMLNKFDIDMFDDVSARPIFEALSDYVANNIEILEEDE